MAICVDSQMVGFLGGLYLHTVCTPPFLKEHDLMFCFCSWLSFLCLADLEGIEPSLHSRCRYLSVGRSILHQSGRPLTLHLTWGCLPISLPLHLAGLACHDPDQ